MRCVTPLEDAQTFVIGSCPPRPPVEVPLDDAEGLVLAADVVASEQVPPFDNSAVDGYAVIAADTHHPPVELPVVCEVAAGAATDHVLQPGEAIRIMTGAPLPDGCDAVVMVEQTERLSDDRVRINAGVESVWFAYPMIVKESAPFTRRDVQIFLEERNIQTRVVFTGNITRQPGFKGVPMRIDPAGLPNSDRVMERGFLIAAHHGMSDVMLAHVHQTFEDFAARY